MDTVYEPLRRWGSKTGIWCLWTWSPRPGTPAEAPRPLASFYRKKELALEAFLSQIDRELDEAKRQDLVRQAEAIFAQDPPLLPVSWEKINDGWFNYVKGHNPYNYFGIYDVVRCDTFWLDK